MAEDKPLAETTVARGSQGSEDLNSVQAVTPFKSIEKLALGLGSKEPLSCEQETGEKGRPEQSI